MFAAAKNNLLFTGIRTGMQLLNPRAETRI